MTNPPRTWGSTDSSHFDDEISSLELARITGEMAERFNWDFPYRDLRLVGILESRTSTLYKLESPRLDAPLVLKMGKQWSANDAFEVYDDLQALELMLGDRGRTQVTVQPAYGFAESPPAVCVSFVPGQRLNSQLRHRAGYRSSTVQQAIRECGSALGLFHTHYSSNPSPPDVTITAAEIGNDLKRIARRVGVSSNRIAAIDLTGKVSRAYGDYAPYNFMLDEDGHVWLVDHPTSNRYAPIHFDVAYFMYHVARNLSQEEPDDRGIPREIQTHLDGLFVEGYASTGPRPLDSEEDVAVLAMYRAYKRLVAARMRVRKREFKDLPAHVSQAWRWRREARRSLAALPAP